MPQVAPAFKIGVRPSRGSFSRVVTAIGVLKSNGFLTLNYGVALGTSTFPLVTTLSGMAGSLAACCALFFLKEKLEKERTLGTTFPLAGGFALPYLGG